MPIGKLREENEVGRLDARKALLAAEIREAEAEANRNLETIKANTARALGKAKEALDSKAAALAQADRATKEAQAAEKRARAAQRLLGKLEAEIRKLSEVRDAERAMVAHGEEARAFLETSGARIAAAEEKLEVIMAEQLAAQEECDRLVAETAKADVKLTARWEELARKEQDLAKRDLALAAQSETLDKSRQELAKREIAADKARHAAEYETKAAREIFEETRNRDAALKISIEEAHLGSEQLKERQRVLDSKEAALSGLEEALVRAQRDAEASKKLGEDMVAQANARFEKMKAEEARLTALAADLEQRERQIETRAKSLDEAAAKIKARLNAIADQDIPRLRRERRPRAD